MKPIDERGAAKADLEVVNPSLLKEMFLMDKLRTKLVLVIVRAVIGLGLGLSGKSKIAQTSTPKLALGFSPCVIDLYAPVYKLLQNPSEAIPNICFS